jgi:Ala-tRNA(Pro) deacylase
MPATPDELFALLDRLGILHSTIQHPPLFTVEQSQALRGRIPGAHTKNLFLKDKKGSLFLVTALEDAAIELKSLHGRIGAKGRLSFGPAGQLFETLGVEPGSVTPFGVMNDTRGRVAVVLDGDFMSHDMVNAHPLTNTMTTTVSSRDLLTFLRATGHEPLIVPACGPPPGF